MTCISWHCNHILCLWMWLFTQTLGFSAVSKGCCTYWYMEWSREFLILIYSLALWLSFPLLPMVTFELAEGDGTWGCGYSIYNACVGSSGALPAWWSSKLHTCIYLFQWGSGSFPLFITVSCDSFLVLARIHGRTLHKVLLGGALSILPFVYFISNSQLCPVIEF